MTAATTNLKPALLLLALLMVAASGTASAQTFGEVRGRILDGDGVRPIAAATVTLSAATVDRPVFSATATTDTRGRFVFPFVPLGVELRVRARSETRGTGATGSVAPLLPGAPTVLTGYLHSVVSENGDCGGFGGYREVPPASFTAPLGEAMRMTICM